MVTRSSRPPVEEVARVTASILEGGEIGRVRIWRYLLKIIASEGETVVGKGASIVLVLELRMMDLAAFASREGMRGS